jgi:hypothetical protein
MTRFLSSYGNKMPGFIQSKKIIRIQLELNLSLRWLGWIYSKVDNRLGKITVVDYDHFRLSSTSET